MALTFDEARACVLREAGVSMGTEAVSLAEAAGRVLAEEIPADRDYPPFPRSARDGFALRASDLPGELRVIGEVRAGERFTGAVAAGEAVEIMTGAALPDGADAVVMVEHVERQGDRVSIQRTIASGENFSPQGIEAHGGDPVLTAGVRIGHAEVAMLATVGHTCAMVYQRPRVAIVATGDEIVEFDQSPAPHQIRNSNAVSLAAQVARAGGVPEILGIARDTYESTRTRIREGLEADLLLLSGGVSAGKYDLVEKVLAEFGAVFFFDRVKIQPGQPLVFGKAQGKIFFGLPGNPGSTMITFETIARAALEKAQGLREPALPLLRARLTSQVRQKTGLTRFLPALLSPDGATIAPMMAHGSGDVAALARCNAFLVTDPDREEWKVDEDIRVLVK
ncbi:MAG: gephyrin-like molybdotransferase Glp [Acidobacteriota bacterium]